MMASPLLPHPRPGSPIKGEVTLYSFGSIASHPTATLGLDPRALHSIAAPQTQSPRVEPEGDDRGWGGIAPQVGMSLFLISAVQSSSPRPSGERARVRGAMRGHSALHQHRTHPALRADLSPEGRGEEGMECAV